GGAPRLTNPTAAEGLARLRAELLVELVTFIQGDLAATHVTDGHATPAPAAEDQPLEQGRTRADRPAMLGVRRGAIREESVLVLLELLPGDGTGMMVVQNTRPVLRGDPTRPPFDPRLLMGQGDRARLGSSIDVGARVRRIMQEGQDAPVVQGAPQELTVATAPVEPGGEAQVIAGEGLDDPARGPHRVEGGEDQAHRLLDLLIGIEDELAGGIRDQPGGRPEAELARLGLGQLVGQQPRPEPVRFGGAHGALDPQDQPVVVLSGIINAVLVDDEGVGQATDFNEAIPVAAAPGPSGGFQAEDGAGAAQADLGHHVLETIATEGGGPGESLVLVDDLDALFGPSQLFGVLRQVILASGAGGMIAHLRGRRLPDGDQGRAVEMLGADLGGTVS